MDLVEVEGKQEGSTLFLVGQRPHSFQKQMEEGYVAESTSRQREDVRGGSDWRHYEEGNHHCRPHLRPNRWRRTGGTKTESCPETLSHRSRWRSEGAIRAGGWAVSDSCQGEGASKEHFAHPLQEAPSPPHPGEEMPCLPWEKKKAILYCCLRPHLLQAMCWDPPADGPKKMWCVQRTFWRDAGRVHIVSLLSFISLSLVIILNYIGD